MNNRIIYDWLFSSLNHFVIGKIGRCEISLPMEEKVRSLKVGLNSFFNVRLYFNF